MLGPVFGAELLRAGRRGRAHVLRWIYAAWLIAQLLFLYDQAHLPRRRNDPPPSPTQATASFGREFMEQVFRQQFVLIILITPAFVAGAITDEKTRGTLQNLLVAHVTPTDIVVGKLIARCTQVGVLALTALPLIVIVGPFGGAGPEFIIIMYLLVALVLFGLGGLSMLASVWTRQTRTAVIVAYVALVAAGMIAAALQNFGWAPALSEWLESAYPREVLAPALNRDDPLEALRRLGRATLLWGGLGAITTMLAIWRLRPAYLRQLEARPRGRFSLARYSQRPKPSRDPMAWKECYIGRRIPLWAGTAIVFVLAASITAAALSAQFASTIDARNQIYFAQGGWVLLLVTLLVGVRCSGTITGERERQTWDGVMLSPLTASEIVRGKLRGILKSAWPYLIAWWLGVGFVGAMLTATNIAWPLLTLALSLGFVALIRWRAAHLAWWSEYACVVAVAASGGWDAATIVGGSIFATWLAMYFLGAIGIWCSARSRSSWRSLLGTVVLGYLGGSVLGCVAMPLLCVGMMFVTLVFEMMNPGGMRGSSRQSVLFSVLVPMFWVLGIAGLMWLIARAFLFTAESTVAKSDRIAPEWIRTIENKLTRFGRQQNRQSLP